MFAQSQTIIIGPDARMRLVWDDTLADLAAQGHADIRRASHVEPTPDGQWDADMTPVGGPPSLGPFPLRGDALAAERAWLERHDLPIPEA